MRVRFKPTAERRSALRAQLGRLEQPAEALAILRSVLPHDFAPTGAVVSLQRAHPDRFVVRAQVHSAAGEERAYALKAYSDDFVEHVWTYAQAVAHRYRQNPGGLCLPIAHIPHERILVFPWVYGQFLSEIVDDRKPQLLREAAWVAAELHRLPVVPDQLTTAQMFVDDTVARCDRLGTKWPEAAPLIEPLIAALQEAVTCLDPADPAPVHGDMSPGQFIWTGDRLILLDLDMFGYTDPAYDAGHFLAQLERRCLLDPTLSAYASRWLACFRDAYLAAMPQVSPRNVSFYQGLTLVRKIYTVCRRQSAERRTLAPPLALRAHAALHAAASPVQVV